MTNVGGIQLILILLGYWQLFLVHPGVLLFALLCTLVLPPAPLNGQLCCESILYAAFLVCGGVVRLWCIHPLAACLGVYGLTC